MTLCTADFEAGVNGNSITTAAGEASETAWDSRFIGSGNTLIYDNTHAYDTLAAKLTMSGDPGAGVWMRWQASLGSQSDAYMRFYVWFGGDIAGDVGAGGDFLLCWFGAAQIRVRDDRTIRVLDNGGQAISFTTPANNDSWFRFEVHVVASATVGQIEARLFNDPDSGTATETQSSAANRDTGTTIDTFQIGPTSGSPYEGPMWLDGIVAADTDWVGPPPAPSQTLYASADSVDGAWTDQAGGSSLAAAIDETSVDDADYIRSELSPSNSGCRVKLAAGSDPASSSDHTIKWRVGKNAAGGQTVNMTVKLYQGGGNSQGAGTLIATFSRNAVTDTITEYTETLSGGEADSITDYSDLYLEFFANAT